MTKLLVILSLFLSLGLGIKAEFAQAMQSDIYAGEPKNIGQGHYPDNYTFFDWGQGQNGWGYCYEFDKRGYVLHNGRPVSAVGCQNNPSYYDWGSPFEDYRECYQWTPYNIKMNDGYPVDRRFCL